MHMGNLLRVEGLLFTVMAATSARIGIDHATVVPANYEPPESGDADVDEETDA